MQTLKRAVVAVLALVALVLQAAPSGQISPLAGLLDQILNSKPTLTTSLDTATGLFPLLPDGFEPDGFQPATWLARTPTGGFVLEPGAWEFQAESFCLRVGTPRPTKGDGYVMAPIEGPRAGIVRHILENATRVPTVSREQIQVLLWAILSRSDIRDLDSSLQRAASLLLTPREIADLSTDTLGRIAREVFEDRISRLPEVLQRVLASEASVRDLAARHASYAEIAAAAVPDDADGGESLRDIPAGRWIFQRGYFVRIFAEDYVKATVQIYVPSFPFDMPGVDELRAASGIKRHSPTDLLRRPRVEPASFRLSSPRPPGAIGVTMAAGPIYEPGGGAGVPGSSGGQRIGISGRSAPDWDPGPPPVGPKKKTAPKKKAPPRPPPPPEPPPDCDPSPEELADAQKALDAYADMLEFSSHEWDAACPPPVVPEDELWMAHFSELAAKYEHGTKDEQAYAACLRNIINVYREGRQSECDSISERSKRLQDHAKRMRELAKQAATDPKGALCAGRTAKEGAEVDLHSDEHPERYPPVPPLPICTPPAMSLVPRRAIR